MNLKPGKHTAERTYSKPISLPHTRANSYPAPKKVYNGKPISKESIRRKDVLHFEDPPMGSKGSIGGTVGSEVIEDIKVEGIIGGGARDGTEEITQPVGQDKQPLRSFGSKTDEDTQSESLSPRKPPRGTSEYGMSVTDVSCTESTFEHMRFTGVPAPSVRHFDYPKHTFTLSAAEETKVAPAPPQTKQFTTSIHERSASPISSLTSLPCSEYTQTTSDTLPTTPASVYSSRLAPPPTPFSIDTTHTCDRAPPRQSIPLTPPPMDYISFAPSICSSPTSSVLSERIVIQPSTIASESDFDKSYSDDDLDEEFGSESDSCYSQSSYHPTVIDEALDAADKMLLDHEFSVPLNAPPVPVLPAKFNTPPADLNTQGPSIILTARSTPSVDVRTPPPINVQSYGRTEVPGPVPIPTSKPVRPLRLDQRQCTAPFQPLTAMESISGIPADGMDLTTATTFTIPYPPDTPFAPAPDAKSTSTTTMNKPLPIELLRRASAKEARDMNPPPRPYSPEFYSTPAIMPTARFPLSPLNPSMPSKPSRPRLQNQMSTSSLTAHSARHGSLSSKSSSASLSSRTTSVSRKSAREEEQNEEGIRATGGFKSWKKASGKISGSWYTPAKPQPQPQAVSVPRAASSVSTTRSVDPKRTYVPPPNGPTTSSRRHTPSTTASSPARRPVGARSQSERSVFTTTTISPAALRIYGPPLSQQHHHQHQSKPSPLGPSSSANTSVERPSLAHAPMSDSLLFAPPAVHSALGAGIMRQSSPMPPLNRNKAEKSVKVVDVKGARQSVKVTERGTLDS
ncbi:hypothetical protein BC629DRAFT_253777 [Irpex lacteus]|nr:hypothetical protein BC629DRAFT_253777 [Irpex lacteus]